MKYNTGITKKSKAFKILYLIFSVLVAGFSAYLLIDYIIYGAANGLTFDDCVLVISLLFALLFQGSITGFIVRSFKAPTILMKNLVFKNDGTPYLPGIISSFVAAIGTFALCIVFVISLTVHNLFAISARGQCFILDVLLIVCVNFVFTSIYYIVYRHESGSFAII